MSSPTPAYAQYIPIYVDPPATPHHWQGVSPFSMGAYNYWEGGYVLSNDSEWQSGSVPVGNVDVRFGNYSGGLHRQYVLWEKPALYLRSLWFEAGTWYTLGGKGSDLTLGYGAKETNPYLLVVNSQDWDKQSEHTIEGFDHFKIDANFEGIGRIENYSEGGLGIFSRRIDLNDQHIQIGGMGATHFASELMPSKSKLGSTIDVGLFGGVEAEQPQPHFILQADNRLWGGALRVNQRGFAIIKTNQALGYGSEKRVYDGGSLALRSHVGSFLNHQSPVNNPSQRLTITGAGIIRREGTERIGALYSDGGRNVFGMGVEFSGDTLFGARGDRGGGLYLSGGVYNSTDNGHFIKVGPGLIQLAKGVGNSWTGNTVIRGGVLRLAGASQDVLPSTSNIVLGGGILELGGGDFNATLGTGAGEIRFGSWPLYGGFSAYDSDSSVTLNGGATLEWGSTPHFLGSLGQALLLSSRYANANITFTNAINLHHQARRILVERGEGNAHAILSGDLSGIGGLSKTGRGLLHLTGQNTYTGATVISNGVLLGAIPSSSNIKLSGVGSALGIDEDFSRDLGTGSGELQWGSGGFAAYGGTHSVTINGGQLLTTDSGIPSHVHFGHYSADGTVDFKNPLNFTSHVSGNNWSNKSISIVRGRDMSRADLVMSGPIGGTLFNVMGDGRVDFTGAITGGWLSHPKNQSPTISIYGAEMRLNGTGSLYPTVIPENQRYSIHPSYGGTLYLDDWGTHDSDTGGVGNANRIDSRVTINLFGGALVYRRSTVAVQKVAQMNVIAGSNFISLYTQTGTPELHVSGAFATISGATLHFLDNAARLRLDLSASEHNVSTAGGSGIIPWMTFSDSSTVNFGAAVTENSIHYIKAHTSYNTDPASTWAPANNVRVTTHRTFGSSGTINSLIMGGGNLTLSGGANLTLSSGGLIAGKLGSSQITGSGTITTGGIRPLYVHTPEGSNLVLSGWARFTGGMSLIQSQAGTLRLNSQATHLVGRVNIHMGTLSLRQGTLSVGDAIYLGVYSNRGVLELAPNRWNQIVKTGGGLPSIYFDNLGLDLSNHWHANGAENAAKPTLRMGGNTKLSLQTLAIRGAGIIDWVGGEVGKANILWIENLQMYGRLYMRNWYEYEDIFLVRKTGFDFSQSNLNFIVFEGYENYRTTYRQWDEDYYQITPFGKLTQTYPDEPEPETYGAILATLGIAVVLWRKRKKRTAAHGRVGDPRNATGTEG